jgi:hypothetical protein
VNLVPAQGQLEPKLGGHGTRTAVGGLAVIPSFIGMDGQ